MIMTRDNDGFDFICFWRDENLFDLEKNSLGTWECVGDDDPHTGLDTAQFKQMFPNFPLPRKGSRARVEANLIILR